MGKIGARTMLLVVFFVSLGGLQHTIAQTSIDIGASHDADYPFYRYPKMIPAYQFSRANGIHSAKISPDGAHMITARRQEDGILLEVEATQPETQEHHLRVNTDGGGIQNAHWLDNSHIYLETKRWRFDPRRGFHPSTLVQIFQHNQSSVKMVAHFDIRDSDAYVETLLLHTLPDDPNHVLIAVSPNEKSTPAVYKLNIQDGSQTMVEKNRKDISHWMADTNGNVRFGVGFDNKTLTIIAKSTPKAPWRELKDNNLFQTGRFFPVDFDFDDRSMIVRSAAANGRFALYRMDLESGRITDKLFEHPDVDVLSLERSLAEGKNLAITYVEDRLKRHFLDADYEALFTAIDKALPNRSNYLLNHSADGRFILIKSVSDRFPGAIYRLDTKTLEMRAVEEINPGLNPQILAPTKRVNYFARDGLEIPAYLTKPLSPTDGKLPAIVLPHSGPHSRDAAEYNRMVQFLASRGYVVLQPNYRGSTGYSFEFQGLGYGEWGGAIQNDIEDAAKYLIAEGIADPDRICIVGERTFDAYSALLGVLKTPELFACGVAISPVLDLPDYIDKVSRWYGRGAASAIKGNRKSKDIKAISPDKLIETLKRPMLMFYGGQDWLVGQREMLKLGDTIQEKGLDVKILFHKNEGHGISMPGVRRTVYENIDEFLKTHLGSPDQSAYNPPVREKRQTASKQAIRERAATVSEEELLTRCLPQHFNPFFATPDSQLKQKAIFCGSLIDAADGSEPPQLMASLYLTRAKLRYLTGDMSGFSGDIATVRSLVNDAKADEIHPTTVLALRTLEILALVQKEDFSGAYGPAKALSDEVPEYRPAIWLLERVARKTKNLPDYALALERLSVRQFDDREYGTLIRNLLALQRYEDVKTAVEGFMVAQIRSTEVGTMAQYYGEAELALGNLNNAGTLLGAVQKDREKAKPYLDAEFPNLPGVTLEELGGQMQSRNWDEVPHLQALYYFEAGQPEKAHELFNKQELEECASAVCLKLEQHIARLDGDTEQVEDLNRLIERRRGITYRLSSKNWDKYLVLGLPALPLAAIEGKEEKPTLRKVKARSNDRLKLYFDPEPATDSYSLWLAIKNIAAEEAGKRGATAFVVLDASVVNLHNRMRFGGLSYEGVRGKFGELEIRLIKGSDIRAKDPAVNWLLRPAS